MKKEFTPWPEELAQLYRSVGLWQDITLGDLLASWARRYRDKCAVIDESGSYSFQYLDCKANELASGFISEGIHRGDRVVIQLPNCVEFLVAFFSLIRIGAIPVLSLPAHRRSEIVHIANKSEAVAYIIPDRYQKFEYCKLADEVLDAVETLKHVYIVGDSARFTTLEGICNKAKYKRNSDSSGLAFFLLSGGTTGLPKLIPRTHNDYAYNFKISAEVADLSEHSIYLASLPMAHNFALGCPGVLGTLSVGGTSVLTTDPSPDNVLPLIQKEKITVTALVPPLAYLWTEAAEVDSFDLSSLRLIQVGGALSNGNLASQIERTLGCRLQESFGMSEGLLSQTRPEDSNDIVGKTQGRPISPYDEVRIVDSSDREVEIGERGYLQVRGPYTIRGYYDAEEYNKKAFTIDGYFRTGDIARLSFEGNLIIEGRADDIINRGGEKVSAEEVESYLIDHAEIYEAVVVSMPDDLMGQRTCAFIVSDNKNLSLIEITDFLNTKSLADFKFPDRLEHIDCIPKTKVGKVNRSILREIVLNNIEHDVFSVSCS